MTSLSLLSWGKDQLQSLGSLESQVNSEWLLAELTGLERSQLYLEMNRQISREIETRFRNLIRKRKKRTPLAYLLGKTFFWNEVLEVSPGCLIPRPETEILVEQFIKDSGFKQNDSFSFLDLAAGSGAIGIALLRHFLQAKATFSDISSNALCILRNNLTRYNLWTRSQVICSDLFTAFRDQKWNAIVCNPPYLAESDFSELQPEVLQEPREALAGGRDGFDFYRRIVKQAKGHLVSGGWLFLEIGKGQSEIICGWLQENRFQNIQCFKDHAKIDRVIMAQANS